jgi:hypothetical protein
VFGKSVCISSKWIFIVWHLEVNDFVKSIIGANVFSIKAFILSSYYSTVLAVYWRVRKTMVTLE